MTEDATKTRRDWWDKAHIISGFLSSVVIAVVGIFITYSIQQAQIESSAAQAEAQLELAKFKAEADKKLQEGQLTATLIGHLASKEANRREIAILALRETTPANIYDNVVVILAKNDPDDQVRQTAITQLGDSRDRNVLSSLALIGKETSRSNEERKLAIQSLDKVNIASSRSKKISVIASSSSGEAPMDKSAFADEVVKGLLGAADATADGLITDLELAEYVRSRARNDYQNPWYSSSGSGSIVLGGSKDVNLKALVVGSNYYQSDKLAPLAFAEKDARTISEGLMKNGAEVRTLLNPTAEQFLETLHSTSESLKKGEILVLYYAGHGFVQNEGFSMWLMTDTVIKNGIPSNAVNVQRVIDILEASKASIFLLVDTFIGFDIIGSR